MHFPLVVFLLFLASFISALINFQIVKEKKEKEAAMLGLALPQLPFKHLVVVFAGVVLLNMAILSVPIFLIAMALSRRAY